MDYAFFLRKIAMVQDDVRKALLDEVTQLPVANTSSNFRYNEGYQVSEVRQTPVHLFDRVREFLPATLQDIPVNAVELGVLAPNTVLQEHTDNTPPSGKGWWTQRYHKIHVVLASTDGWCTHRRSRREDNSKAVMRQGGVYLFNNYVFHSVGHSGTEPRVHLVAHVVDEHWEWKRKFYDVLGLPSNSAY